MTDIARDQNQVIGNGSHLKIRQGQWFAGSFQFNPEGSTDERGLTVEVHDRDPWKQKLFQVAQVMIGPRTLVCSIDDRVYGDRGDELLLGSDFLQLAQ